MGDTINFSRLWGSLSRIKQLQFGLMYSSVVGLVYPLVPLYLKVRVLELSIILSSISMSAFISSILWGRVADSRERRRKVIWATTLGGALSYGFLALSPPLPVFVALLLIANAFTPGVVPVAMAAVSEAEDSHSRMGSFWIGSSLGYAVGTMVTGFALQRFGVTPAFATSSIMLILILLINGRPSTPLRRNEVKVRGISIKFWVFTLVTVFFLFTDVAKNLYIPPFFAFKLHLGDAFATASLSVEALLEVPTILLFNNLIKRADSWKTMGLGVIFGAMYLILNATAFNLVSSLLDMCSYCLVWGAFSVSSTTMVSRLSGLQSRGTAYGVYNATLPLANVMGPLYVGAFINELGYRMGLVTMSVPLIVLGMIMILWWKV